jgi:hypothetical protein
MCAQLEVENISNRCRQVLNLQDAVLPEEYFYQSLPFCVIDAVYSIGVKYASTKKVVINYCNYFKMQRIRNNRNNLPQTESQESIEAFLTKFNELGIETFKSNIFDNRQRTSSRNGILKSEAVFRFAEVLKRYSINFFQDVPLIIANDSFESDVRRIPGQTSGISLNYFFMLAGSENFIKADRMIIRFLENILNRPVTREEAQSCLAHVKDELIKEYPNLTLRLFDSVIWNYQRRRSCVARKQEGLNRLQGRASR